MLDRITSLLERSYTLLTIDLIEWCGENFHYFWHVALAHGAVAAEIKDMETCHMGRTSSCSDSLGARSINESSYMSTSHVKL